MHSLGIRNYTSNSCSPPFNILGRSKRLDGKIRAQEEQEAADTGLFLIDVTRNWRTSGIMIHTPFSGHFPWAYYNNLENCGEYQRRKVIESFPADIGWVLKAAE